MNRPLIVTDCDEVLLHMVVPFGQWLSAEHDVLFDFAGARTFTLRDLNSGERIERERAWTLLRAFFATEMHRQYPIAGAVEAIGRLSELADIVVLTNIGEQEHGGRVAQLRDVGITHRVICNQGGKGPPLAKLIAEFAPSVTLFIDDIAHNHESVAEHVPDAWRLHMVGEPELAAHIPTSPHAHERIDNWAEAEVWLRDRVLAGLPAPLPANL